MKTIDLHTHSTGSDGSYSPSELISYAVEQHLSAVAITDHDTMRGIPEAMEYISDHHLAIELIPGMEVSTYTAGHSLHILAFFPGMKGDTLAYVLNNLEHDIQAGDGTAEDAISRIKEYGGLSSLAHPQDYFMTMNEFDALIENLTKSGLNAIEAIYTTHSKSETDAYKKIAKKHDLFYTGGTDFHGSNKPGVDLGFGFGDLRIPYDIVETMKYRISQD